MRDVVIERDHIEFILGDEADEERIRVYRDSIASFSLTRRCHPFLVVLAVVAGIGAIGALTKNATDLAAFSGAAGVVFILLFLMTRRQRLGVNAAGHVYYFWQGGGYMHELYMRLVEWMHRPDSGGSRDAVTDVVTPADIEARVISEIRDDPAVGTHLGLLHTCHIHADETHRLGVKGQTVFVLTGEKGTAFLTARIGPASGQQLVMEGTLVLDSGEFRLDV